MPDETPTVPPALTRKEWARVRDPDADNEVAYIDPKAGLCLTPSDWDRPIERPAALMAVANEALPDGDPRKLTRELADGLRLAGYAADSGGGDGEPAFRAAAIIAALLPPE